MGFSHSNRAFIQFAREATEGTIPSPAVAYAPGYNSMEGFNPTIEMTASDEVSPRNQVQAGQPVDKLGNGSLQMDLSISRMYLFVEGAMHASLTGQTRKLATSATTAHFVVPTMAGALPARTLVYVRGCAIAANNGLKVVDTGGTTTQIPIVGGLIAETGMAARGVTVSVVGYRFASGDAQINASGHLIATTKNLTDFALRAGQGVILGSVDGTATNTNRFATAANRGPARIAADVTASLMQLENTTSAFAVDAGTGKEIDLYYGMDCRVEYLTGANFLEPSWTAEVTQHRLGSGDVPAYSYTTGLRESSQALAFPEKSKATMGLQFVGRNSAEPTTTRATGFSAAIPMLQNMIVNTTSNIKRGRIRKLSGSALRTGYITAVNVTFEAQTERNGAHGVMGAVEITQGKVMVKAEVNAHFTVPEVIADLVAGELMGADWFIANNDGGMMIDLPQCQLSGGAPEYPLNQTVRINLAVGASEDPIFGTSCIINLFDYVPLT